MPVVDAAWQAFADPEADPVSLKGRSLWASEQQQGSSVFGVIDRALEPDVRIPHLPLASRPNGRRMTPLHLQYLP
jgi:hypothetical protein